jgi:hypothetical protein
VKALEEGIPYQTLIASVLHKYVTGRLTERPESGVLASRLLKRPASCLAGRSVSGGDDALRSVPQLPPGRIACPIQCLLVFTTTLALAVSPPPSATV